MTSTSDGDWMQTYSGLAFFPLNPDPEGILIEDIAHALGMLCRYGGHVEEFYSVAEHCVLMSRTVAPENALCALLHDATEAYVSDLVRPVKRQIPQYEAVEDNLMDVLFKRFKVDREWPQEVTEADTRILLDEREILLKRSPRKWDPYIESMTPLGVDIRCWSPSKAEDEYLRRFDELVP